MSFEAQRMEWLEQVACDPGLPPLAVRIAIVIAKNVNRHSGDTWRAVDRMAHEVSTTGRSVQRMTRALADAGHLEIEAGSGRKNTNRYRWIIRTKPEKGDDPVTLSDQKGDGAVTHSEKKGDHPVTPSKHRKGDRMNTKRVTGSSQKGDGAVTRTSESTSDSTPEAGGPPPGADRLTQPDTFQDYDSTSSSDVEFRDSREVIGGGLTPPPPETHEDAWPILNPIWITSPSPSRRSSLLVSGQEPDDFRELFGEIWSMRDWPEEQGYARILFARALQHTTATDLVAELQADHEGSIVSIASFLRPYQGHGRTVTIERKAA